MSILKSITTSIGWLAGSLAAISAVLGGCGFIVVRSHSSLLGLGDFLQYSNHQYVIEGAQFLLYTIFVANETVLRMGVLLLLTIGVPFFVYAKSARWAKIRDRLKNRMGSLVKKHAWLFLLLACIVLIGLFFFRLVPFLDDLKKPMTISDLLVADTTALKASDSCKALILDSACIASRIVRGERAQLEGYYFGLLLHYLEAALILFLIWRLSVNWSRKIIVRLPFAAMFLVFTLLMPMCYGVLVKPAELCPLTLKWKNDFSAIPASDLFILQKSDNAFIAWNHEQRKIVWYPANRVAMAIIGNRQHLFQTPLNAKEGSQ